MTPTRMIPRPPISHELYRGVEHETAELIRLWTERNYCGALSCGNFYSGGQKVIEMTLRARDAEDTGEGWADISGGGASGQEPRLALEY